MMKFVSDAIPEISDEELLRRTEAITVIMATRDGTGFVRFVPSKPGASWMDCKQERIEATFEPVTSIQLYTLRTGGGQFNIDMREVLAQVPDSLVDGVQFVELKKDFDLAPGADYFVLEAVLHKKAA